MSLKILLQLYVVLLLLAGASLNTLVDSEHSLPAWYDPGMQEETLIAWDALQTAASEDGIKLTIFSGYRSYEYQAQVYDREIVGRRGQAPLYLTRPGHSEHQLGTAIDVAWPGLPLGFNDVRNDRLYEWLRDNAHLYGFVISYPYKTSDNWPYHNRWLPVVTEYIHEPWHIRYVGDALAEVIYNAGYLDPSNDVTPQDFYRAWP
ncbi:MAG: M15 family metallopeptidase [Anaerolineaceae bacterium]|nr:MAG: M15 family metallopeptidase [Anaerolineaceae bacterium]